MSKHTPSKYQAAVYHFITDGSGNAVVEELKIKVGMLPNVDKNATQSGHLQH